MKRKSDQLSSSYRRSTSEVSSSSFVKMIMKLLRMLLWCCLFSKPAHSYLNPFLSTMTKVVTRNNNSNNLLAQIMSGASDAEQLSSTPLLKQQGGVIIFLPPFLSSILSFITQQRAHIHIALCYILLANTIYLQRRSCLRKMTKRKLLKIRTTREEGVNLAMYITNILVWQIFVTTIFPLLEPFSRLFGYVSFYYFYPNAGGFGIIFEPLSVQHLSMSKRQRSQIRLDWHRFSVNRGNVGRDGYRHPPSVEWNLPHIDVPRLGLKHWPWRRKHK